jgi:dTDP-4-amino-4,6-dideoxygalactose transaminase
MNIPFHIPYISGEEMQHIELALKHNYLSGGNYYTQQCEQKITKLTNSHQTLLTSSCTHALEMCALLLNINPGDEVIMSSFTFVSAANAFVLRGAKIVFVDIREDTLNIDENLIEGAITGKTKAIVAMHYGGVGCNMEYILAIGKKYNIAIIEDAAHCIGATYQGQHLGTFGDLGTLSFHDTKNIHCGEGGALLINNPKYKRRAEILRDKGTNRKQFNQGFVDKYSWIDIGSSYYMSEISAAFLYAQLIKIEEIKEKRRLLFNKYNDAFKSYADEVAQASNHHLFTVFVSDADEREKIIHQLSEVGIKVAFHYVPLHTSEYGRKNTFFHGSDTVTIVKSSTLLRLPLYYDLSVEELEYVVSHVKRLLT